MTFRGIVSSLRHYLWQHECTLTVDWSSTFRVQNKLSLPELYFRFKLQEPNRLHKCMKVHSRTSTLFSLILWLIQGKWCSSSWTQSHPYVCSPVLFSCSLLLALFRTHGTLNPLTTFTIPYPVFTSLSLCFVAPQGSCFFSTLLLKKHMECLYSERGRDKEGGSVIWPWYTI